MVVGKTSERLTTNDRLSHLDPDNSANHKIAHRLQGDASYDQGVTQRVGEKRLNEALVKNQHYYHHHGGQSHEQHHGETSLGGVDTDLAQNFEALFLNSMFQQMFAGVGDGPFGGGHAAGVWRSFMTDEYAKSFAQKGGVGIADQLYKSLLAQQEIKPAA